MSVNESKRNWIIRIQDILECISKIQSYTSGLTFDQFQNDNLRIDAVVRNLEIIGEAAGHIPIEIQEKHPDLAWLEMRGMRNIVTHEYFGISIPIIWQTIEKDLPLLAEGMKGILREQE